MCKNNICENNSHTNKKPRHRKRNNYRVEDVELLYLISDKGLLHENLRGVHKDKDNPNKFVWFFKKDPEIGEIIAQYQELMRTRS